MSNTEAPTDRRAIFTQHGEQPLDLKGLVDTFARRWKLFVAVSMGCLLLAVIVSLILKPTYESVANIRIDPTQKSAIDLDAAARGAPPDQALVDSEVKIVQSPDVASEVVRTLGLTNDPEFNPTLKHGGSPFGQNHAPAAQLTVERVLKHLDVTRLGSTYIIAVRFRSPDASKATDIANAFAREYLLASVRTKVDAATEQSTWITDRLNAAGHAAQTADAALAQYRAEHGILASTTGGTVTEQQIATLTTELAGAEGAAAAAQTTYAAAKGQAAGNNIDTISSVINSPTIVELRKERADLLRNQADVNSRYGPKHPETIKITQQVQGIEAQMRDESQRIVAGLESDARAAEAKAQSLRNNLSALRGQMGANSQAGVQADSLQRDADAKKTIFNQLAAAGQQANQQQHMSDASAQIVGRAAIPTQAAFPNKPLFASLGAALGLILGAAAVFVAELLDSGVRTVDDVEQQLGVNFIASTQLLTPRDLTVDGQEVRPWDYVVSRPMSGYAEAMRNTRSAIMLSDLDKDQKVVAITSALPSEGKTVCSVSLARVMAMSGERVILVDCDLRRNALEGLLATTPEAGLIEVLTGAAKLDDVIVPDAVKGLDLLPLNKAAFSPRDLFGTKSMSDLLATLRERYDHVVLDGPPILAVTDARTLAKLADAVILIAHWNRTPRYAIQAAVARLNRDQAHIAGLLLTMVDKKSRSSMGAGDPGYYYGQYHKYYHD
jgi:succinoglycan biosynthesis transport protein ExoP